MPSQEELLKKRPHILVATPGRLLDLLDSGATTLSQVRCLRGHLFATDATTLQGGLLRACTPCHGCCRQVAQGNRTACSTVTSASATAVAKGTCAVSYFTNTCFFADAHGQVCYVVLDEADKMLSLGFQPQLDRLHQLLLGAHPEPAAEGKGAAKGKGKGKAGAAAEAAQAVAGVVAGARPQVLLFTATMPAEVEGAAGRWLRRPVRVVVTHSAASISRTITQVRALPRALEQGVDALYFGALRVAAPGRQCPGVHQMLTACMAVS